MGTTTRIGVLGPNACTDAQHALGFKVGYALAEAGATLVCGGLGGMMLAAAEGAKKAHGLTVGILPGPDTTEANAFIDLPLPTGLGPFRNMMIARMCQAVIAIHGSYGTLSEIAFALRLGIPVVGLETWKLYREDQLDPGIHIVNTPEEAVQRATAIVEEKNPDLPNDQKALVAKAVGIGAVKYADYSNNRNSDFIFSFDKMLAMEGNTAPYMQYAYARIKSIERKAEENGVAAKNELANLKQLTFTEEAEKELGKMLIRYDQGIAIAAEECRPNYLTSYLYDLAQTFSRFYNACPVLKANPVQRPVRLLLCDLTARTIKHGLSELLGIEVVKQM